jgi:hypothetical protein
MKVGDIMCLEIMVYRQHLDPLFDIHRFSHAKAIPRKLEFPELTILDVLRAVSQSRLHCVGRRRCGSLTFSTVSLTM